VSLAAILLFAVTMLISLWATIRVKRVYARWSDVKASSGLSGAEVAASILDRSGIHDVEILEHDEFLGDHYDPVRKRLVLSSQNYHGTSVAALGVAAHECGHAVQHKVAYGPLHWRMSAVAATQFSSQIVLWLPLLGMFTGHLNGRTAAWILSASWGVIMLFNLITLPVEFDASRRAKSVLGEMGFLGTDGEIAGVRKMLDAAAWTYVAAFITSFAYFLWHLVPLLLGGRRE
jgi:Zn-dependent membrane protease YugP